MTEFERPIPTPTGTVADMTRIRRVMARRYRETQPQINEVAQDTLAGQGSGEQQNSYMAVIDSVTTTARNLLRDFPKFFQVSFDAVGRTYELGNTNIDTTTFWVATAVGASATALNTNQYDLDARNGILRLTSTQTSGTKVMVEGYYYEWVLPSDLEFYAQKAINQHAQTLPLPIENATAAVIDVIGMAALIECLWALMTEYARDIDVMTSESIHIPGSQRFRMLQSLIDQWEGEYRKYAKALNIGPERIEIMNLRRVSRTTNRYIPLYQPKEIGEYGPMERLFPDIDKGLIKYEDEEPLRVDVFIDMDPPTGVTTNTFY